jgi:hypothetical protein
MKKIFMIASVFLMLSLVCAAEGPGSHDTGTGSSDSELMTTQQGDGQGSTNGSQVTNAGEGQEVQFRVGEHTGVNGQQMMIRQESKNQMKLEVGGKSATSSMNISQENVNGQTRLTVKLSNGKNAEIKIMPDKASETALARLRLKNCVEADGCSIELKETGSGDNAKLAYEVKTQRKSKVFGLFNAEMDVEAQVDAETGKLLRTNKPWWAFLASEPEE